MELDAWVHDRTLGSGGFGAVYLYRNKMTGQAIAVKQCRQTSELTDKNRSRWTKECDIMLRLNHPNVVRGLELPEALDSLATGDLPVLAMEFCELGDLRKVLNRPENCYGLPEFQVRHIVNDVSSAVEYLHSQRIIHRDLKPENIVLHDPGTGRVMYKLIDLGYAKDLTNDSMCTSFVGTLQYLAPELFTVGNPNYTSTVDYWSLGTTVFECICGMRPFLPNLPPVRWVNVVSHKKPEHIHALLTDNGKLEYSDKLPTPNNLCSLSQVYFEQWLRMVLLYDPKTRGQRAVLQPGADRQRPYCFEFLEKILTLKLVRVYSAATNEVLGFAVTKGDSQASPVAMAIQSTTHIDKTDQELLTTSGKQVDLGQDLGQYCVTQDSLPNNDIIDLYLFSRSGSPSLVDSMKRKQLPRQLQIMLENPDMDRVYADQVEVCKHVIYYCTQTNRDIVRLVEAQRVIKLSLISERTELSALVLALENHLQELVARIDFFSQSVETDLSEFETQRKTTNTFSKKMYIAWTNQKTSVLKYKSLRGEVQSIEQLSEDNSVLVQELEHTSFARDVPTNQIPAVLDQSKKIYERLRSLPQDQRIKVSCTGEIVRCIEDCLTAANRLTIDIDTYIRKIIACKVEVSRLATKTNSLLQRISQANDNILHFQRVRQKDIWRLLTIVSSEVARDKSTGDNVDTCKHLVYSNNYTPGPLTLSSPVDELQSMVLQGASLDMRNKLEELVTSLSAEHQQHAVMSHSYDWSFLE